MMSGRLVVSFAVAAFASIWTWAAAQATAAEDGPTGCLKCHEGIEAIREDGSRMLAEILELGEVFDDPNGCVVCHGGEPTAEAKEEAHGGDAFYPDPGSPWINEETCGQCHPDHTRVQWHSLMMTEAGKIHGVCWAFGAFHREHGAQSAYEHFWGNYDVENPADAS